MKKYLIPLLFVLFIFPQNMIFAHEGHGDHHHSNNRDDNRTKCTFLVADGSSELFAEAVKSIWKEYPFLKSRVKFNIISKADFNTGLYYHDIEDSSIIVADDAIVSLIAKNQTGPDIESIANAIDNGITILLINRSVMLNDNHITAGLKYDSKIIKYYSYGGIKNIKNMIIYSLSEYAGISDLKPAPPKEQINALYSRRPILEQLWITGVLVAFSVFGIKAGLGLGSQLYSVTVPKGRKLFLFVCAIFSYSVIFFALYYLITHFNLLNYLDQFMSLIKYGMYLHLAVAFGLLIWGAKLLLNTSKDQQGLTCRSCLLLILPCPVCIMAIFLNLTLTYSLSPLSPLLTTLILFIIFGIIIFLTLVFIFPFRGKIGTGSSFLGTAMSLIAVYFLLTLIFAPIYPKIKDVFAMASSNTPVNTSDHIHIIILAGIVILLIGGGFIKNRCFNQGVSK